MDNLDKKILRELIRNSRIPITLLARKLMASREVVDYRIKKLKDDKIILDFTTEFDFKKLGYIGAAVFVQIKSKSEENFKNYLETLNNISWFSKLTGIWSFGFSILARNEEELNKSFLEIFKKFELDIIDYRFLIHNQNYFLSEKIFGGEIEENIKNKEEKTILDKKDKQILKELIKNSRTTPVEISNKLKITAQAISNRIKILNRKLNIKYSVLINFEKINLYLYSVFIKNKNLAQKNKLINFLKNHPQVNFIVEYLGDEMIEFGIFVENPYLIRKYLKEIEEEFPESRLVEISLFQQDIKSIKPPECLFVD